MTDLLHKLATEAAQLTRTGRLQEATQAIQRALQAAGLQPGAGVPRPAAPPAAWMSGTHADGLVLDGLTRVLGSVADPVVDRVVDTGAANGPQADASAGERWLDGSFTHQGRSLAYKLYLPPTAGDALPSPRPLVLMLHGCTQGAADFAAGTQMHRHARELGVVLLYPEQTQHANAQKCWNWFKPQHQQRGRGEPAVLAALTQSITVAHQVDPARVFVAGLSAGGAMADILGHCYPDLFAAVGVHSGLPIGSASDVVSALAAMRSGGATAPASSSSGSIPPTIVFHGDADATVHVSNAALIVAAAAADRPAAHSTTGQSGQGRRYTRTVYARDDRRGPVEYWKLHGAGHAWAGGSTQGSYTDPAGADASAEMLRFFLSQRL